MPKIHLTKEYERDISLIVEALWAQKLVQSMSLRLKIKIPWRPFIVFYVTGENMQIWEHAKALSWYKDRLLEKNKKGKTFIQGIIVEYKRLLAQIQLFWEKGPTVDKITLKKYIKLVAQALTFFPLWYYSLTDERTPKDIRKLLFDIRKTDEFFARNDSFFKDCVELLGGGKEYANLIFPEEFPNLPSLAVLKKRARGIISIDGKKYFSMSLDKFASTHPEYSFAGLAGKQKNIQEISGQVAFRGNARGVMRIVKNKKQMQKVKTGEILVSPMTTPDFMPAMRLAAAIITDEGGITCHAAIVARELKKPCIIGTKIATKVLKDGMMVEVDADKGVVKILNNKN